tara:strand:- start:38 stop:256 length:219 start_codon:yes stop_codon:yes gene_type:complete
MRYEVRVRKLIYDFYHIEADSEEQAKKIALNLRSVFKVDTIRMKPEADYSMLLTESNNLLAKEVRDLPMCDI